MMKKTTTKRTKKAAPARKTAAKRPVRKPASRQATDPSCELAMRIARIADDRKAEDIKVLDLRGLSSFTDYFVICSGASDRQVQAVADAIRHEVKQAGRAPLGEEGMRAGHWALVDYGEVVAHVFYAADRDHYGLERLWYDAPRVALKRSQ